MSKQEKRARTLLEYMGFKDPDIKSNDHDDWCLRLLDDQVIKELFYSKQKVKNIEQHEEGVVTVFKNNEKIKTIKIKLGHKYWTDKIITFPCGCNLGWYTDHNNRIIEKLNDNSMYYDKCKYLNDIKEKTNGSKSIKYDNMEVDHREQYDNFRQLIRNTGMYEWMEYYSFENKSLIEGIELKKEYYKTYEYLEIEKIDKQIEKVLSSPKNNFRFGFLDVYAHITWKKHVFLVYENEIVDHIIYENQRYYNFDDVMKAILFFEIKINQPTLGEITREIEYYKDVISTIYGVKTYPIVISSKKYLLPEQFDCLTFDEFNTLFPRKNQLDFNEMEKQ